MPELPEVETVRRGLSKLITGKKITAVKVFLPKTIQDCSVEDFIKAVTGSKVKSIGRRAKILLLNLSNGKTILVHLKMSGRLIYYPNKSHPVEKHTRLQFNLDNNAQVRFIDTRKFGYLRVVETNKLSRTSPLSNLGPEPLEDLSKQDFKKLISSIVASKRPIKNWLMDQSFIAGIGNLYADEILYAAGIKPTRLPSGLTSGEVEALFFNMRVILNQAIKLGGSSFNLYVDASGRKGSYQRQLKVYRRRNQACNCGEKIIKIKLAGRSTHFCPSCQK
jgi:formamidopyrimidine-DNA glycosylase